MSDDVGPLALVVDQGTTSIKVTLVDRLGQVVSQASATTELERGHGTVTARPHRWWLTLAELVRRLGGDGDLTAVSSVAVGGFMHTLVPVADRGQEDVLVLLPGDVRGAEREDEFADVPSAGGRAALARLAAWGEGGGRVHGVLTVKDYLRYQLTGVLATDAYDAGGCGLVDVATRRVVPAAAALVSELGGEIPAILGPAARAGSVTPQAAEATGLGVGTPVVTGSGDWLVTCLGAQAAMPERMCLYLGSSAAYGGFDGRAALAGAEPPRCLSVAVGSGSMLAWAGRTFADAWLDDGDAFRSLLDSASMSEPGAAGVRFVPHGSASSGSREAGLGRGELRGLNLDVGIHDIARAVLEGVALWIRRGVEPMLRAHPSQEIVACGGGARDRRWPELLADVLGHQVTVAAEFDTAALGLARLAFQGTGQDVAWPTPRVQESVVPRRADAAIYQRIFDAERAGPNGP